MDFVEESPHGVFRKVTLSSCCSHRFPLSETGHHVDEFSVGHIAVLQDAPNPLKCGASAGAFPATSVSVSGRSTFPQHHVFSAGWALLVSSQDLLVVQELLTVSFCSEQSTVSILLVAGVLVKS